MQFEQQHRFVGVDGANQEEQKYGGGRKEGQVVRFASMDYRSVPTKGSSKTMLDVCVSMGRHQQLIYSIEQVCIQHN